MSAWKRQKQEVSGMTNHEYLKQQSAEWLADKLAETMDCDCCPAADHCAVKILGVLPVWDCQKTLKNWLNAERTENE